jgi:putative exosortase-associated protein (TIGR04073 family)
MKKYSPILLSVLMLSSLLVFSSATYAEEDKNQAMQNTPNPSYADKVSEKAFNGVMNMTTSALEIPKNIINVSNESNIAYGFIGGTLQGILNMVGRLMTGTADVATALIPTKPSINPAYVWDDFDADTIYGKNFRLDNQPEDASSVQEKY